MAKKKRKWITTSSDKCDIAMGPMIDCTFLLLMYFISVSTIDSVRISKSVVLPLAKHGIIEKDESGRFIIDIEWHEPSYEATFKLGPHTVYDARALTPLIQEGAKQNKRNFRVVIRVDRRVPYEFTQQVMAAIAAAKVPNMIFSTLEVDMM